MSVMHVTTMVPKIGESVKRLRPYLWTAIWTLLSVWAAYNLGSINADRAARTGMAPRLLEAREGIVSQPAASGQGSSARDRSDARVVVSSASKSMKYHHPWCSGASRINEVNRVWYPTADAARAAGYSLAGNCAP